MTEKGKYIYCIIGTDKERVFDSQGIGGRGDKVQTICYRDIGAVISDSPMTNYPINRENTLAHQVVMEEVMKESPLLPVRFCTIGESIDKIREKVLKERYDELKGLLTYFRDKSELGVKALWGDMKTVFEEIVEENPGIKRLRDKIAGKPLPSQGDKVTLGEMVKSALDEKKCKQQQRIVDILRSVSVDYRENKTFGDKMITNSAFLVEADREEAFDDRMNELITRYDGMINFKYVGPLPPANFVEITIKW